MLLVKNNKQSGRLFRNNEINIRGVPLLGILPEIKRDPLLFLRKIIDNQGATAIMRMGMQRVIMIGHPDAIAHVSITEAESYHKLKYVKKLKSLLGDSLITSNAKSWDATRKVVQRQMTMSAVNESITMMDDIICEIMDRLERQDEPC